MRVVLLACVVLAAALSSEAAVLAPANVTLAYFGDIADRWLPYDTTTGADCLPTAQTVPTCAYGAARAKAAIGQIEAQFPGQVVVAAVGGYAFGAEFARVGLGKFAAQYLTDIGLDVSGTASAEWFDGATVPLLLQNAGYDIVNSDLFFAPNRSVADAYGLNFTVSVQLVGGVEVGFFALTDASIVPITSLFASLGTKGYHDDHFIAARRAVQLLGRRGINKIVLLLQYNLNAFALVAAVPGIDAVVVTSDSTPPSGKIEFGLSADGVPVPILTCTSALTAVCWTQLQFDEYGYLLSSPALQQMAAVAAGGPGYSPGTTIGFTATGTNVIPNATIVLTSNIVPDAALMARVNNDYNTVVAPTYANNVAVMAQALPFDYATSRRSETLLGNALSDALRAYSDCDVMLLNAGAVRAGMNAGNFSVGDVQRVLPLAATLTLLRVRGDVLLQILENGVSMVDSQTGTGRFLTPAGLDYGYNAGQNVDSRITFVNIYANLSSGGVHPKTPLQLSAYYTVGMSTFDAMGGDGYDMLANATILAGKGQPRLDLAAQEVWARQGLVLANLTGRIVNDSSVTAPRVTLVQPTNAPINGGVTITLFGEGLYASDPTLVVQVGPRACTVRGNTDVGAVGASTAILCLLVSAEGAASLGATTISAWRRSSAPLSGNSVTVPRVSTGLFAFTRAQQLCPAGAVSTTGGCQCEHPWAPDPKSPGNCRPNGAKLENEPDSGSIVLALIVPAFGIWTAQTFLDQSINVGMTKFRVLFAAMSTLCLSMALWATLAFGVASISLPAAVAYNPVPLMMGLLVSLAGTGLYIGFTVYVVAKPILSDKLPPPDSLAGMFGAAMGDAKSGKPGSAIVAGSSDPRRRAVFGGAVPSTAAGGGGGGRGGRAPLVTSAQAVLASHARQASTVVTSRYALGKRSDLKGNEWKLSWHVLLASYLLLQAIFTTHFCVFASLRVQATYSYDAGALAAAFIVTAVCCTVSTVSYFWFFTSPLRLGCVLGFVLAQVLFYFVGTARMAFAFDVDAPPYFTSSWSAASVQLAAGLVTFIAVLIFVGLALARLRLSQNELSKTASTLRIRLKDAEEAVDKANETVERQQYWLRLISLTRPLDNPKHFQLKLLAQDVEAKDREAAGAAGAGAGAGAGPSGGAGPGGANGQDEKSNLLGGGTGGGVTGGGPNKRGADPNDPTFDDIVAHPATLELLKDVMTQNHTLESLSFYLDVLVYKTMKKQKRHAIIHDLVHTYVKKGSPYEVNIDALMAQRILQKVEKGYIKRDLFDEAEREVHKLIDQNDMPRLRKSHAWDVVKLVLKHDKHVGLSNVFGADAFGGDDDDDHDAADGGTTGAAAVVAVAKAPPPAPAPVRSVAPAAAPAPALQTAAPGDVGAASPFGLAPASPRSGGGGGGGGAAPFSMANAFRSAVGASTPELAAKPAASPVNPAAEGHPLPVAAVAKSAAPAPASPAPAPAVARDSQQQQRTVGSPLSASDRAKISPFAVDDAGPGPLLPPSSPAPKPMGSPAAAAAASPLDRPPSYGSSGSGGSGAGAAAAVVGSPGVRRATATQRNRDAMDVVGAPSSPAPLLPRASNVSGGSGSGSGSGSSSAQPSPQSSPVKSALTKQHSGLPPPSPGSQSLDTVVEVRAAASPSSAAAAAGGGGGVAAFDGVVVVGGGGGGGDGAPPLARPSSMLPSSRTVRKYDAGFGL